MKKIIIVTLIAICPSLIVNAQKNGMTRFTGGVELGIPAGTSSNANTIGIGASLQAEHFYQENISGTGYIGVLTYFGKNKAANFNVIPVRIGARFYANNALHFGLQLGLGFTGGAGNGTAFAYSPQIGYNFKTNSGKSVDATFKYDGYAKDGTFSALGIRIAYVL